MTRVLVVGAAGQLGTDLVQALRTQAEYDVHGVDLPAIDITDPESVAAVFAAALPAVVVNCAAYTAVDAAETHEDLALRVNGLGPRLLAEGCRSVGARLVHLSTDYVFDGEASEPYAEDAAASPCSAYGRTKLAGEVAVRDVLPDDHYIVRTAWLYGCHGSNFVKTMLRLEQERDVVAVVDDQWGQPTYSGDLARQIVRLIGARPAIGTYHGTNSGEVTWFGLTQEVFRLAGADPQRVLPTTSADFVRPAPRPAYSVLGHDRWAAAGIAEMRPWQEALQAAFADGIDVA